MHEALLVEGAILPQAPVDVAADTGGDGLRVETPGQVALVEDYDDLVAVLEARDALADGGDGAGAVRGRNDALAKAEGVLAAGNDQIAVV